LYNDEDNIDAYGGIWLAESGFAFVVKLVSGSVKKSIRSMHLKWDSDSAKHAWIHFRLQRDVFTAKRPFNLPYESETGFTVNSESRFYNQIVPMLMIDSVCVCVCV